MSSKGSVDEEKRLGGRSGPAAQPQSPGPLRSPPERIGSVQRRWGTIPVPAIAYSDIGKLLGRKSYVRNTPANGDKYVPPKSTRSREAKIDVSNKASIPLSTKGSSSSSRDSSSSPNDTSAAGSSSLPIHLSSADDTLARPSKKQRTMVEDTQPAASTNERFKMEIQPCDLDGVKVDDIWSQVRLAAGIRFYEHDFKTRPPRRDLTGAPATHAQLSSTSTAATADVQHAPPVFVAASHDDVTMTEPQVSPDDFSSGSVPAKKTKSNALAAILSKTGLAGVRSPGLSRSASVPRLHRNISVPKAQAAAVRQTVVGEDEGKTWVGSAGTASQDSL